MYKAVIFDLDGTLLDTLDDLTISTSFTLNAMGKPNLTKDKVREYLGNGVVELMRNAFGHSGNDETLKKAVTIFNKHYKEQCTVNTKPYDDIIYLLNTLRQNGIKIGIVSNKRDFAVQILAKRYFDGLTDVVIGESQEKGVRKKPHPDSILLTADEMEVKLHDAVYIGDSEVDIEAAKNSNLDCISVTWGFRDKDFLLKNGAKVLVDKPLELFPLLLGKG